MKSKEMIKRDAERNIMRATLSQTLQEYWKQHAIENEVGEGRNREYVVHRHAFAVACEKYASVPLKTIGRIISRDHATVLHAKKNHESNYRFDSVYHNLFNKMEADIIAIVTESGVAPKDIEVFESVSEELIALRVKNMKIVGRMRKMKLNQIAEIRQYEEKLKHYDFMAKQNKEFYEKNKYLQAEVNRLRNLL